MKSEKKTAEKEAKVKEQLDQKKESNEGAQNASGLDEETLDPNVRTFSVDHKPYSYYTFLMIYLLFYNDNLFPFGNSNTSRSAPRPFRN